MSGTETKPEKPTDVEPGDELPGHIEPEPTTEVTEITPTVDHMDRVILAASKLDEYGKARNAVLNFIIKQSYPGDWVSHSLESVPKMDRTANLGAAGCERIANLLGIHEFNWKHPRKEWTDNRLHYSYVTEADFEFAGRRIHVISRVGTRDKFWRTEYKWNPATRQKERKVVPLEDVREDYIEKASFRGCRKEGVRTLLGLRNIPLSKLDQLGFNIGEVRFAAFKAPAGKVKDESGKVIGAKADDGTQTYRLRISEISPERKGRRGPFYVVVDISGDKFYLHAGGDSERLGILRGALMDEAEVTIKYVEVNEYKNIVEVIDEEGNVKEKSNAK